MIKISILLHVSIVHTGLVVSITGNLFLSTALLISFMYSHMFYLLLCSTLLPLGLLQSLHKLKKSHCVFQMPH